MGNLQKSAINNLKVVMQSLGAKKYFAGNSSVKVASWSGQFQLRSYYGVEKHHNYMVSEIPSACVEKLSDNKNSLTIIVNETYYDGTIITYKQTFSIHNNAAAAYQVGSYKVYVDTKRNTKIRQCYLVK